MRSIIVVATMAFVSIPNVSLRLLRCAGDGSITRYVVLAVCLGLAAACGGDGGGSPSAPTSTTSVSVTFPAGGTILIGSAVQLEARETLSNGTTRVATNVTWGLTFQASRRFPPQAW